MSSKRNGTNGCMRLFYKSAVRDSETLWLFTSDRIKFAHGEQVIIAGIGENR